LKTLTSVAYGDVLRGLINSSATSASVPYTKYKANNAESVAYVLVREYDRPYKKKYMIKK